MPITFRPATPSHIPLIHAYREDGLTLRHNPVERLSLEETAARQAKHSTDWADFPKAESFSWLVESGGEIVGITTLKGINRSMFTAEIGYGIFAPARGKGLASEVVKQLTKDAFQNSPLRRLYAYVHDQNLASRRVLDKCGYSLEGVLREHYLLNGEAVNECVYGILKREAR
jgi:[ribosomal protein S5]-alanine N-acetyltransferase